MMRTVLFFRPAALARLTAIAVMRILVTCLVLFASIKTGAQSAGDYQSKQSGNWNAATTWQRHNGTTFVDATAAPDASSGTITIRNGHTVTVNSEMTGKQIVVASGGIMSWSNGNLNTNLTNNGTINYTSSGLYIGNTVDAEVLITNKGTFNWNNGDLHFQGVTFNNNAGASFIANGNSIYNSAGTNQFINAGTIIKQSANVTAIGIPWQNSGTVNINEGELHNSGVFTNTGTINIAAERTLVNSNQFNCNSGGRFSGNGIFRNGNILNLNDGFNIPNTITFNFIGGDIGGTGTLTINGTMNWSNGNLNANLTNNGTINYTSSGLYIGNTVDAEVLITNKGTFNWNNGDLHFQGVTFNNNAGASFIANGNSIYNSAGTNQFNNAGTITKQSANVTAIGIPWQNSGTVNVNESEFHNNNTFTNTGRINIAAEKTLVNNNQFNWNSGGQLSGNGIFRNGNILNLNDGFNIPNTITFNFIGGDIGGTGTLTINGTMNWSNGNLNANLTNNGTINYTSSGLYIGNTVDAEVLITNNGTFNWSNGDLHFQGVTFNNNAGASFVANGNSIYNSAGTNQFNNAGTITKQSTNVTAIGIPWQNSGTVNINEGELHSNNPFVNTGKFNLASGKVLVNNNTFSSNTGSQFSGSGIFRNNGTFILNAALNLPGTITLNQVSGQIRGGNVLTVNGVLNWTGGNLNTNLTSNGAFNLTNGINIGNDADSDPIINNNGTFNWNNASINFWDATFNNNTSGIINANENNGMGIWSGNNILFNNAGTFNKQNGTGITTIGVPWQNSGTVNINEGELHSNNSFVNTGKFNLASGKVLVNNNTFSSNTGSQYSGSGIFRNNGTLILNAALNLPGTITLNQVSGQIRGGNVLTVNGVLNWTGGNLNTNLTNNGTFNLTNGINIGNDADPDPIINNNGTFNWNNASINFWDATFNNNASGIFNANENNGMGIWSGNNILFNNAGTFNKQNGTGTTTIGVPWQNSGTIKGIGTIAANTTFTNTGTIEPGASPGILQFIGSSQPLSATSTLQIEIQDGTGAGTGYDQLTRNADLTLAGKLKVVKTGDVPKGSYIIIQLSSGNISGNFSDIELPAGFNITVNPTNVVLGVEETAIDSDRDGIADKDDCEPNDSTKWRSAEFFIDKDGDGYDNGKATVCYGRDIPPGYIQTSKGTDCNDNDAAINPATVWYKDADNDGYSDGATKTQCDQPTGYKLASQLTATNGDCDDDNAAIHPGAPEICGNGIDEDCDGKDGVCAPTDSDGDGEPDNTDCAPNDKTKWRSAEFFIDKDGDGYDNGKATVCYGNDIPSGYIETSKGSDCNDNDASIHPGATEICGNGIDENCDGKDDSCAPVDSDGDDTPDSEDCAPNDKTKWRSAEFFIDKDGDGYDNGKETVCYGADIPAGYKETTLGTDCNDNNAAVHPGAAEICDGIDNNCNGQIDEGVGTTWYRDADGDGYGDAETTMQACERPTGYVANSSDCNDNDASINPGATETADGKDNDCNGLADDVGGMNFSSTGSELTEGDSQGIDITITRPVPYRASLVVNLSVKKTSRLSLPASVTIPAGQAGATFNVLALENNAIEGPIKDTIAVRATGMPLMNIPVVIIDNDNPSLSITRMPDHIQEGQQASFRVSTNLTNSATPVMVYLTSSGAARLPVPASVTIAAGSSYADVNIAVADNNIPQLDETITITAGAAGHEPASTSVTVTDDDIPGLELVIETNIVSEGAGYYATKGRLRRAAGSNAIAFTANLSAGITNTLILPASIALAANENEKSFDIGVIDNTIVDGEREVIITASVFVSSCGCSAPPSSAGSVEASLKVSDNDGKSLTLSMSSLTLPEGLTEAGILRVGHNDATLSQSLTVRLTSSDATEATVPATVTIPAGQQFVDVPVTTISDGIADGNQQVYFTATATGFATASVWVVVSDLNRPDLELPSVTLKNSSIPSGALLEYTVSVKNSGQSAAPAGVALYGYLSKDDILDDTDSLIIKTTVLRSIAAGETLQAPNAITAPDLPGDHKLIFKINADNNIAELLLTNNTAAATAVSILPDYTATASVAQPYYMINTAIPVTGTATRSDGSPAVNKVVEVYIITNGLRRTVTATTNNSGQYSATFTPLANEAGHYTVGASYPGMNKTEAQDNFDILGVLINEGMNMTFLVHLGDTLRGTVPVQNRSNSSLTHFSIAPRQLPTGATIVFDTIASLAGNATVNLGYTVTGTALSAGTNYETANMQAIAGEGNVQPVNVFYFCQARQAYLVADVSKIDVKVSGGTEREFTFRLINKGAGTTGAVSINLPQVSWLKAVTPLTLPALGTGDTALVILKFSGADELPFEFPITGNLVVSTQTGNSLSMPFSMTKVSEISGAVKVIATDQFTYFTEDAPNVAGASVKITNYYTGEVYAQGITGADGVFIAENIPQGQHRIIVEKEKHQPYNNVVSINPADTSEVTAFLNYQAITFNWTVVPTAIQDQYDIILTAEYETHVPVPVITVEMPSKMPQLSGSEIYAFNATLTNHGLITANDVQLEIPNDPEYEFVTNYVTADLLAQQSIQVPFIMRRKVNGRISQRITDDSEPRLECTGILQINARYACGATIVAGNNWIEIFAVAGFSFEGRKCGYNIVNRPINGGQLNPGFDGGMIGPCVFCPGSADQPKAYVPQAIQIDVNCQGGSNVVSSSSRKLNVLNDNEAITNKTIPSSRTTAQKAVCASVTVQFSQILTMTREAFDGTLEIFNGHPTDKMDSLSVNILITDANGVPSNGLFEIQTAGLNNLSDIMGHGAINAQERGSVKFLFIPEQGAAPTTPKVYNFGGSVTYFDPYAQAMVTMPLAPVPLTVNPSPNLMLHYFMQRNILGDDPLTSPEIEPMVPAELAVMVENHGYGPAVNMTISSAQPKIVENEKGLAIDFKLTGSNLQGQPTTLGLTNINFGTIPALATRIGQWYFTSTLLGKFVSYKAEVKHANSFGNPDLSLVKGVKLHELTKSIRAYGDLDDGINDFLVNDIADIDDMPDIIYFSQGKRTAKVYPATGGSFASGITAPSFTNTLTVTASATGWNYIKLNDPGNNQYELVSVTRNDGTAIPLDNAWLSFVTLPAGAPPVYENKFHFVDTFASKTPVSYTVVWRPKNTDLPEIVSLSGAPASVTAEQVKTIRVVFNKAIDPASFTYEDLALNLQSDPVTLNAAAAITPVDATSFDIDLSAFTTGSGFYSFTVQAAGITDLFGTKGQTGKNITWTQFFDVPVVQQFRGIPETASPLFDKVQIVFNLPIDEATLTPQRFSITREGIAQGGTLVVDSLSTDKKTAYLSGLQSFISSNGTYELSVDLPNIRSTDNAYGKEAQSVAFVIDREGPVLSEMKAITEGGLDAQHVPFVSIRFDENVTGFNTSALTLTRNGEVLPLQITQLSNTDLQTWLVGNLELLTYPEGSYQLAIDLGKITDEAGNHGNGIKTVAWTVSRSPLLAITNLKLLPDKGYSGDDGITYDDNLRVSFVLNEPAAQVTVSQVNGAQEQILMTVENAAKGVVELPVTISSGGTVQLKVTALDAKGIAVSAPINAFIDMSALQARWNWTDNQVVTRQPDTIDVVFSSRLLAESAILPAIELTRNGDLLSTGDLQYRKINDTTFHIYGIRQAGASAGNYRLALRTTELEKYSSGKPGDLPAIVNWTVQPVNNAPVANAGTDKVVNTPGVVQLDGSASSDPDEDAITYQWAAPEGIVLNDPSVASPSFSVTANDYGKTFSFLLIVSDGTSVSTDVVTVQVIAPGTEICDGIDNDGDGEIDEGIEKPTWYRDTDRDGFGDSRNSIQACEQPIGYVADNSDCNDNDATIHPGATELCDGKDNNCDGVIDEGCGTGTTGTYYSKPTGDLHNLATWGANPDGSGTAPADFGTDKVFILANRGNEYTMTGNWPISGTLNIPAGAKLAINGNTLSLATLTGTGTLTGSAASSLAISGTGDFGALHFSAGDGSSLKALTVNRNGTVTIGTALNIYDILTVTSGTLHTGNQLTLKSNVDNTARVTPVTGNIVGNVTVERYIPARRAWRIMSAPVAGNQSINEAWQEGVTLSSPNPNPYPGYGTIITKGTAADGFDQNLPGQAYSVLSYNSATDTWADVTNTRTNAVNKTPYFLFVRGDRTVTTTGSKPTTLRVTGPLKLGDQLIPTATNGYTAVANPFASPINFATITRNNVDNSFYVWDPKMGGTNGVGAYVNISFNGTGYDIVPKAESLQSQYIQSGQGFLVHSSGSAGSIVIKESDKSAIPARNVFKVGEEKEEDGAALFVPAKGAYGIRVNLQAADSAGYTLLDEVFTSYSKNFEDKIDGMDVKKLYNVMENISLGRSGQELMVERRSPIRDADTIYLRLDHTIAKNYMLEFAPESLEGVVSATLVDHYMHSATTISTSEITQVLFMVNGDAASSGANRFELHLSRKAAQPEAPSIKAYPNPVMDGDVNLQFNHVQKGKYRIELVNSIGKIIVRREIRHAGENTTHRVNLGVSMTAGIYYLRITGDEMNTHIKLLKK